ncbi:hypothetical protein [Cerasicoccus fimbriatus]|uniref:hypothetical protein n=1 Tax=Cerasicoccus fimbriatus TaxID=3014554 RepID=UPI0022B3AD4B|nr:hypothetical protein [Cerasicoccus sp. TK19100]
MGVEDIHFSAPRQVLEQGWKEFGDNFDEGSVAYLFELRPLVVNSSFSKNQMLRFSEAAEIINFEVETSSSRLAYIEFISHVNRHFFNEKEFYSDMPEVYVAVYFHESVVREFALIEQIDISDVVGVYARVRAQREATEKRLKWHQDQARSVIERVQAADPHHSAIKIQTENLATIYRDVDSLYEYYRANSFTRVTEDWEQVMRVWRHAKDSGHCVFWTKQ